MQGFSYLFVFYTKSKGLHVAAPDGFHSPPFFFFFFFFGGSGGFLKNQSREPACRRLSGGITTLRHAMPRRTARSFAASVSSVPLESSPKRTALAISPLLISRKPKRLALRPFMRMPITAEISVPERMISITLFPVSISRPKNSTA